MSTTQTWEAVEDMADFDKVADFASEDSIAIQSQYDHAPNILALADIAFELIDSTKQLQEIVTLIATLETAQGIFLDWLGKRIGASRNIVVNGQNTTLDDEYYRFLIGYRAVSNVSDSSIATMNRLLTTLIGLPVFVIDNQDMSISVRVLGQPTDLQVVILQNYGLLTRAAGVEYNIIIQNPETAIFGFDGSGLMPFEQGVFNPSRYIEVNNL